MSPSPPNSAHPSRAALRAAQVLGRPARLLRSAMVRLSFRTKFVVVGVLLAGPLCVLAGFAAAQFSAQLRATEARAQALTRAALARELVESLALHRGLTASVLAGGEELSRRLVAQQAKVAADLNALLAALPAAGQHRELTAELPDPAALQAEVQALMQLPDAREPLRNFERHNLVIDQLLLLLQRTGNRGATSNGPQLAGAYELAYVAMPMLVESLGRQRGWGSAVLQQEQFSDSEVARHLMLAGAVAQRLELFEADRRSLAELDRLLQSQGQGAGAAERLLRNAVAEAEVFSQRSLAQVLSRAGGSTTAAQHFAEGTTAIERLLAGSREVTRLLQVRTAHQQARAAAWLRVAQAALLLLLLVLAAVYLAFERTTVQRLLTLKAASGRIAAGDFDDRVAVEGSDEIAALARALDTMRQGLRQAVDDRANALAERETERERTEFLARWSHDLRTPLAAVLGFARLLGNPQHGALSAAQQADLERIETAAEHLLQLVDDVLAVSTQALREAAPLATPLALAAPVHDALTLLEPEAAARGVSLQAQLPPNLPAAQADRTRLVRVLGNLVANAVKFNQRGGWVRVSAALEGTELRIDVADNGPGIAVADQPRLFKPFERLDAGARGVPGTGLGLATVRRLLESQGGRIALTSPALAAGGGCTFSVWLPQASAGAAAPAERIHTTGHKLAYVEDNPTNVELMRAMLAVCGHDGLVVCPDGASALRAAGTGEHFDLWIIDRQLPDSDGLQLLAELTRRLGQRPHAVLFTADAMPERRQQALDAGFADCWTKPLALESLQAGLARLLS